MQPLHGHVQPLHGHVQPLNGHVQPLHGNVKPLNSRVQPLHNRTLTVVGRITVQFIYSLMTSFVFYDSFSGQNPFDSSILMIRKCVPFLFINVQPTIVT